MTAFELMELLAKVPPETPIIPGNGSISHPVRTFSKARISKAFQLTKPPHGVKYLEMPESGKQQVVILEQ